MKAEQWIRSNLIIVVSPMDTDAISWGNGIYTEVTSFLTMFSVVIQDAIDSETDVRQAIIDNDSGRGFAELIQLTGKQ